MCERSSQSAWSMLLGSSVWLPATSSEVSGTWVLRIWRPPLMCRGMAAGVSARALGCLGGGTSRWSLVVCRYVWSHSAAACGVSCAPSQERGLSQAASVVEGTAGVPPRAIRCSSAASSSTPL
eukprot:9728866-Prorocentrum_lima.AAC.1